MENVKSLRASSNNYINPKDLVVEMFVNYSTSMNNAHCIGVIRNQIEYLHKSKGWNLDSKHSAAPIL